MVFKSSIGWFRFGCSIHALFRHINYDDSPCLIAEMSLSVGHDICLRAFTGFDHFHFLLDYYDCVVT